MEEKEAVRIFDLVVREHMLPESLDRLVPLSFMGAAAVKFYQAKVKLMDQLGATEEQRAATLRDGQDAGEMLLNIEARIGELLPPVEDARRIGKSEGGKRRQGQDVPLTARPEGMEEKQAYYARTIHRNPEAVAAIIKEARENDDIPTKTAVLNKIRADRYKADILDNIKKEPDDINEVANGIYTKLVEILVKLTKMYEHREYIGDFVKSGIVDTVERILEVVRE